MTGFWSRRRGWCLAAVVGLLTGCGGGPPPPSITEVEGTLRLNGKPLPTALVEFIPEQPGLGPEWISRGTTDKDGRFQLMLPQQKNKPGAAVGLHRVVVRDAPAPAEARGPSAQAQQKLAQYQSSLVNRPIPPDYTAAGTTTARVEIKGDQKTYEILLKR